MCKKYFLNTSDHKGFALIEIMVVVAILSVAAAILIPRFLKNEIKKKQIECHQNLQALFEAEKKYFDQTGHYTQDVTVLNWAPKGTRYEYRFLSNSEPEKGYLFECYGNIDNDSTVDYSTINQTGNITIVSDDVQK